MKVEFLKAVSMKNAFFWDATPCCLVKVTEVSGEHISSIFRAKE
jgi:hypothetical protein